MKQLRNIERVDKLENHTIPPDVEEWIDRVINEDKIEERVDKMDKKWWYALGYILSIVLANFFVAWFGLVTWFGWLTFPAGAIFIGLTFSMRDFVQREWGHIKVWYFMITTTIITTIMGVVLSHLPVPLWKVAVGSAVAFIISEAIDWFVFYVFKKDIVWRISVSNIFSTPIDSILFVGIVFGSFNFLAPPVWGQTLVKYLSGLLVIPIILWNRKRNGESLRASEGAV